MPDERVWPRHDYLRLLHVDEAEMTELLGINARGEIRMGVPPAELIRVRKQSTDTYVLDIGPDLWAPVDVEWVARLQRTLTAALIDGGDVEHVTTPEHLARIGGAA